MSNAPALIRVFKQGAPDEKIWAWIDYTIDWNSDVAGILVGKHLYQRGFSGGYKGIVIKASLSLWPDDEVRVILG